MQSESSPEKHPAAIQRLVPTVYLLQLPARNGAGKGRSIVAEGSGVGSDGGAWGHSLPIVDGTGHC